MKTQVIKQGTARPAALHTPIARATSLSAALALALFAPTTFAQSAGTITSTLRTIDDSRMTTGEHDGATRMLARHLATPVVPRRSYVASCSTGSARRIFKSFTSQTAAGAKVGTIISGVVGSGGAVTNFEQRQFPGCKEMGGIVAAADCSEVAVLCRRPEKTGANFDMVASLPGTATDGGWKDWLMADGSDDAMWLYEWRNSTNPTSPTSAYRTMLVSKAIGGKENAHFDLAMSDTHYAASLKSTTTIFNGLKHEGDSLVVFSRGTTPAIDTTKGWKWECANGHTRSNRVAYNKLEDKFAVLCTTDSNHVSNSTGHGAWMHVSGEAFKLVKRLQTPAGQPLITNGGAGRLLPTDDGFIGVIVASPDNNLAGASQIWLTRFDMTGTLLPNYPKPVASYQSFYASYPQLVSLGKVNGVERFLLGWAKMLPSESDLVTPIPQDGQRIATEYNVKEIDENGVSKTPAVPVVNGWGEQDAMVSLGYGRAGWVYRPDPAVISITPTGTNGAQKANGPSPISTELSWTVY